MDIMLFRNLLTKTWVCWSASRSQFEAAHQGQVECQADVSCPGQSSARIGAGARRGRNPRVLREGLFSGRWVKELQIRPGVRSRSCQGDLKARKKE